MIIRVYTGTGTSRNGAPLLVEELSKSLDADVSGIHEDEMRGSDQWKKETSTLVFAGQSVRGFKKALGDDVIQGIQDLVRQGAFDYIGICAGAAFASAQIKYRVKEFPLWEEKKIQNNGLAFFNGLATGPCRSITPLPFSGGSENLHLITLRSLTDGKSFNAFHWGGPALIPMSQNDGRMTSCLSGDSTPMSLRLAYGQGHATIFSYHPEIHAGNIGRWADARFLPNDEILRLETLAAKLDGTAFTRFLNDADLRPKEKHLEAGEPTLAFV